MLKSILNWHPLRWVFVLVGISLGILAWDVRDAAIGIFAFFILYQGLMNVGCIKYCYMWQKRQNHSEQESDEITFEEVL